MKLYNDDPPAVAGLLWKGLKMLNRKLRKRIEELERRNRDIIIENNWLRKELNEYRATGLTPFEIKKEKFYEAKQTVERVEKYLQNLEKNC